MPALKLYVKIWCPWCVRAQQWLDDHGYHYELLDVEKSRADYDAMIKLSGQRLTPTLLTASGQVLPDFGPEELAPFLKKHCVQP
jgi:glutaredoxin 3